MKKNSMMLEHVKSQLLQRKNPEKARTYAGFFKTNEGQYGYGDIFLGVSVPEQRTIAGNYFRDIELEEIADLLGSEIHEFRLTGLLMLVLKYEKAKTQEDQLLIVDFYLDNRHRVNNWDLVDTSCYKILGHYCFQYQKDAILLDLAAEECLWSKRIAVVSTLYHVRKGAYELMKALVLKNLNHPHDLMHKANGWLLREMGKKDEPELMRFLENHAAEMPRTSLRYAIERFDPKTRQYFLGIPRIKRT